MSETPAEQKTIDKGAPARAWLRLQLISANERIHELEFVVDTGNPCAIIIDTSTMQTLRMSVIIVAKGIIQSRRRRQDSPRTAIFTRPGKGAEQGADAYEHALIRE